MDELRQGSGSQFCPRCVAALERLLQTETSDEQESAGPLLATAL
jgi:hypothetical protein